MSKYLIFGATGSIGSNLAEKLYNSDKDVHLLGRDEEELKKLSSKLSSEYTVIDILNDDIYDMVDNFLYTPLFCERKSIIVIYYYYA